MILHTTAKIFRACLLLALMPATALAQTATQNYTKTTTYRESNSGRPAVSITYYDGLGRPIQQRAHAMSSSGKDIVTHIEYDAAGRQAREYLPFVSLSPTLDYSPSAATDVGNFYGSPNPAQTGNPTFEATGNPYSEKLFEASPLARVLKQAAPGNAWKMPASAADSDHTIRTEYLSNSVADGVKLYRATVSPLSRGYYPAVLSQQGIYPAGALYKTVIKDENWTAGNSHTSQEFKNKEGQVVLKRTWGSSVTNPNGNQTEGWHDTYYVYDDLGNLAYVMPPLSDGSGSLSDKEGLCYQYRYDDRKRLVEKKLPGKQWEYIVYDNLDRIVATGPALSPFKDIASSGWLFTKYDVFGRMVYTGWMQASVTSRERNTLQTTLNTQTTNLSETKTASDNNINGVTLRYTNQAWPAVSGLQILTVNYYDDYAFPGAPANFGDVEGQPAYYNLSVKPKGLPTGSWTRVIETSAATTGELAYTLYDYKARPIRTHTLNYLGGYTQVDTKLDFSGKTVYAITRHKRIATATETAIREDFTYTAQDRLLTRVHTINSNTPERLAKNTYDELGQLISKKVGGQDLTGSSTLQDVNYSYSVRGWLKGINDTASLTQAGDAKDLFAFKLYYEAPIAAQPLFNGNIAEAGWRTASDNKHRRYSYSYDAMNRLTHAAYIKEGLMTGSYNESMKYDRNGNITSLNRNGGLDSDSGAYIQIDELYYAYETQSKNRLMYVEDGTEDPQGFKEVSSAPTEYFYDANGNMTKDLNKGITQINYNHLNLPMAIVFGSESNKIEYLYDAKGKKLKKTITSPNVGEFGTIDYLDGFQYRDGKPQFFPTSEGYVRITDLAGIYVHSYVYNYTDHLGNIRLSYAQDPASPIELKILEENHYYPFGLKHTNYNSDLLVHRQDRGALGIKDPSDPIPFVPILPYNYKYNGQEWQDELGLNMTAMDFRQYDSALGRFHNIDMLAELAPGITPYRFAFNNPIFWNDPTGLFESEAAAMAHIKAYGLTNATVSYNKSRDYWEIDNNGYSFGYINGSFKVAYATAEEGFISYTLYGFSNNGFPSETSSTGGSRAFGVSTLINSTNLAYAGDIGSITNFMAGAISDRAAYNATIVYKYGTKTVSAAELTAKNAAQMSKLSAISGSAGLKIGIGGILLTVGEDFHNDNLGAGTVAKVALGTLSVVFPGFGLVYGFADVITLATTGTSLTNHIGNAVDSAFK